MNRFNACWQKKSHLVYSSYDDRPSRLFDGLEHIRLTIHVFANAETEPRTEFSSRYNKWPSVFRPYLLRTLSLERSAPAIVRGTLPKLSSPLEQSIIRKLEGQASQLGLFISSLGQNEIYYSRKVGYFLQVLDFEPTVLDGRGHRRPPSEFKTLAFNTPCEADAALCALNSSLFYWFVTVFSDCRHLNKREVEAFPLNLRDICGSPVGRSLGPLARDLMSDIQSNSVERRMICRHDTLKVQCIIPKHSKLLADKIDTALGKHYQFTAQELANSPHVNTDLKKLFTLIALNCALRNGDAHLKNFGILYDDVLGEARLAPVYDLVTTSVYIPKDGMALTLNGSTRWPTTRELQLLGETRAACTPAQVRGVLSRISLAIMETSSEMQNYIKDHSEFTILGEGMLNEWRRGISESLSPLTS